METYGLIDLSTIVESGYTGSSSIDFEIDQQQNIIFSIEVGNQTKLIKTLKDYNIESIPMPMRHSRTLGGGFHCVTLDLKRG